MRPILTKAGRKQVRMTRLMNSAEISRLVCRALVLMGATVLLISGARPTAAVQTTKPASRHTPIASQTQGSPQGVCPPLHLRDEAGKVIDPISESNALADLHNGCFPIIDSAQRIRERHIRAEILELLVPTCTPDQPESNQRTSSKVIENPDSDSEPYIT